MNAFVFDEYSYNRAELKADFSYHFENGERFKEVVVFNHAADSYDDNVLDKALRLAFLLIGISYYKAFPSKNATISGFSLDSWQASFLNSVFQEGLGQFAFENGLTRNDLVRFIADKGDQSIGATSAKYTGQGILALQSGGKDSLLLARLLESQDIKYDGFYISSSFSMPDVLTRLNGQIMTATRIIDHEELQRAQSMGGLNGHIPVTFIVSALSLVQAVLMDKAVVLTAIGHEGEEPHAHIGDLAVNHQWSKTWSAEKLFTDYIHRYISKDIRFGSPLRRYSELRIAELFSEIAWNDFSTSFSSCNVANYQQGHTNKILKWCGRCPKCANSYLLFSPFVPASELKKIFGSDLYAVPHLVDTFKGLLGVEGYMKPFECIGEVDELRQAYRMSQDGQGYQKLPFEVPYTTFDWHLEYSSQSFGDILMLS